MIAPTESPVPLIYVMGPSGAGKDTLLSYARARVDPARIAFTHRYITRPAAAGAENHISLTVAEFAARREAGLFALSWEAHGLMYGIGIEIDDWCARGVMVVVSGARTAWPEASRRYRHARGLLINASSEIRAARLVARRREDESSIRARLARDVTMPSGCSRIDRIDNDGPVAQAGNILIKLLEAASRTV